MGFLEELKRQVLVIDGAMGTMIQNLHLTPEDFGGMAFKMLSDLLIFSRPEAVQKIHLAYYRAGAHAVETNTFGATPLRLAEFDFKKIETRAFAPLPYGIELTRASYEELAYTLSRVGAELANQAKAEYQTLAEYNGRPLFVIGSIGPSNWVLSNTNANLNKGTWGQIESNFYHQVLGLVDGGADVLLYETQQDILEVKAAVAGGQRAMKERGKKLPIMVQVTVDQYSKMQIFNTDIHAALVTVQGIGIDTFGINCSLGPDLMAATIEKMSRYSQLPISVIPNAGLPVSEDGKTVYKVGPKVFADYLQGFVEKFGVNIVGGCCGTTPAHIEALAQAVRGQAPRLREIEPAVYLSGPQKAIKIDSTQHLIRIGERLNVRGSQKVRDAVENAEQKLDFDSLEEVVTEQVKDLGLEIIDVCMDSNLVDTNQVLPQVVRALTIDFPGAMCLDSFDVEALGEALKVYPGRPLVNSISMEEYAPGVTKIDALVPLAQFHRPLYIGLATGPKGPGLTAEEKLDLARQILEAAGKYGVTPDQILIDVNAFPIGAESIEGMNFAMESLRAIPLVKALHPDLKTTMGVGNLTNGLAKKPYMRMVLTSVFLDEARQVGLDSAIVNPNHYVPVASLDAHDYQLAWRVIRERDMNAFAELEDIAEVKKGGKVIKRTSYDDLPLTTAICEKIKEGFKERASGSLEFEGMTFEYQDKIVLQAAEVIRTIPPLDFINLYLMKAMQELGDKFGLGEVSLPHLLKAADVMKQVMGFLENYMKRKAGLDVLSEIQYKGTVVLGTVYQDVHSIGKDLAKTLLENYGYRVIDLGVQVPLEKFIATAQAEKADAIGMSALLVQTSNHMITVARMMRDAGISLPILIGGAPVNKRHAGYVAMWGQDDLEKIKSDVFYCPSAMEGVNTMKALQSDQRESLISQNRQELVTYYLRAKKQAERLEEQLATLPRRQVSFAEYRVPSIPWGIQEIRIPLSELTLDTKTLYGLNWKLGGKASWERKGLSVEKVEALRAHWVSLAQNEGWLAPQGRWAVFPCQAEGDEVIVYDPADLTRELARVDFTVVVGKGTEDIFSAAQFFLPPSAQQMDLIGFQISTGGTVSEGVIERFKREGDSEAALMLQGLSDRVAEDMADQLHARVRQQAGLSPTTGARYSPGYPGLENIAINRVIHHLLKAEELGIQLTEAHEFIPTGTTGAVVCFHPNASYG